MGDMTADPKDLVMKLFENFAQAPACKCTLQAFNVMCAQLGLDPLEHITFYSSLKDKMTTWKAKALWSKLDKRFAHKEYKKGQACVGTKCLVIGGGPCGLRTAIELALMGAKVVVIEKRDSFSRNNVLHLWPFTIHDLRGLGAKKFYGKFCAGAIDHISIQQLQLMLLKIALIVGVEFHINVEFVKLLEPSEDQENEALGWRAGILPADHPVANFEFDVVVGADGRRNTLEGFSRTEFRGKLAIAITANFTNRNTTAEAKVEEISGLAFIFNQKFFLDLKEETGIDLENIVYYKDKTHYFVMTAKKQSLLDKGVVIHDYVDTQSLLCSNNVNQEALLCYAREAADFGTNYQLPTLDYATNHYGQPDVAMFDFTSMHASEHAAVVRERHGRHLLVALVGDSLLEPFWPMGTGCARGFLAALDTAWMVRGWAQERPVLELLAERESIYRLLPQTTPENLAKNFDLYTIDPGSRYPNKNFSSVKAKQVRHLYVTRELNACPLQRSATIRRPVNIDRRESEIRPGRLLTWCQKQTEGYRNVSVTDLTSSWHSGLALCALIHRFNSQLVDFSSLTEEDAAANLQLAFDVGQREFGVAPFTSGQELSAAPDVDKTQMILYLSKIYELFRGTPLPQTGTALPYPSNDPRHMTNGINVSQPRKRVPRGSVHQPPPQSTDKCHSCGKRVYVVERISTEGLYFHRECFRCKTCNSPLSQGAHVYDSEQGKLYCKAHFVQHKNGTHLRRNINGRTVSCFLYTIIPSPTGTLTSLLRKGLSWPMSLTRAACGAPRQLSGWLQRRTRALGVHVRANGRDYAFLYELLSVGLPLLLVLQGVLQQMYVEAAPAVALCLQPARRWLEENAGLRLT
uniref:F-actin monooxygenase n=1 Tax=Gadus morhua TaxID=8049 RepID=A0A8C4YZ05_GADMO